MRTWSWLDRRVNQPGPIAEPISHCQHQWTHTGADRIGCLGPCGVVAIGGLAAEPPVVGMDWNRATLVTPNGRGGAGDSVRDHFADVHVASARTGLEAER